MVDVPVASVLMVAVARENWGVVVKMSSAKDSDFLNKDFQIGGSAELGPELKFLSSNY